MTFVFQPIEASGSYISSLQQHLMRPQKAMSAFIMLAIMMASSMGCIGLVPAREFMEDLREPSELVPITEKINSSHTFSTDIADITGSTLFEDSQKFEVRAEVTEISAYITAAMPLELLVPVPTEIRYFKATLTDANGEQVWYEEITKTERKMVATFQQPLAEGTWTLEVEARGYGEEFGNLYKDSFQVLIKIESQCWKYPNEDACSFD